MHVSGQTETAAIEKEETSRYQRLFNKKLALIRTSGEAELSKCFDRITQKGGGVT